jgi:hypothetical protein
VFSRRKLTGPKWNLCPGLWSHDTEVRALLPQNTQEWVTLYSLRALGVLWPLKLVSTGHFWLRVCQWWWQMNKNGHIDVHLSSDVSSIKTATQPTQAQGSEWTGHLWCAKGVLVHIIRCKETVGNAELLGALECRVPRLQLAGVVALNCGDSTLVILPGCKPQSWPTDRGVWQIWLANRRWYLPLDVWKWRLVMRNQKETHPKKFPVPLQTGRPQRSIKIPGKLLVSYGP